MVSVINAVILAAGRGQRMGQKTEDSPKCLLELSGKTLLEWQTIALKNAGIKDIAIVRGYMKEKISRNGYILFENKRWGESNMVTSLLCADEFLKERPCIVSYSDIVYSENHVCSLKKTQGDITITYDRLWHKLWHQRFETPLDDAETFKSENGFLRKIGGKPVSMVEPSGQYMGLLKFTPAGWKALLGYLNKYTPGEIDTMDMTSLLSKMVNDGFKIKTVPVDGQWCECDTEKDIEIYEQLISETKDQKRAWSHDWR